ncbi:OmpH family outer membrane protein [Sinisalibacter aestuarii]|nr:OmpH family outer membrane protein [Sinisalibacter aestuarii]
MLCAAIFVVAAPGMARAQELGRIVSPILTIDRDRLFSGTLFGQRVNRELEAESNAMAAETRAIEAALEDEEQQLTEQRPTLSTEEFRSLANAFDEKVQSLRAQREQAESGLRDRIEAAQAEFFDEIGPILGAMVRARGAVMILDRRAILLAATDIDITDEAIAQIDAVLGEGTPIGNDGPGETEAPAPDGNETPQDTDAQ